MIEEYLNQSVTIYTLTGRSYDGDPTYDSGTAYPARISFKPRRILKSPGVEVPGYARVTVTVEVADSSIVAFADGVKRTVLQVKRIFDGDGVFHHSTIDV